MSETQDKGSKGGRKPLTVSRGSSGTVKQTFSHGRSKQVVVETKKRRSVGAPTKSGAASGSGQAKPSKPINEKSSQAEKLEAAAKKLGITVEELV